jgi:hypothetical protein
VKSISFSERDPQYSGNEDKDGSQESFKCNDFIVADDSAMVV